MLTDWITMKYGTDSILSKYYIISSLHQLIPPSPIRYDVQCAAVGNYYLYFHDESLPNEFKTYLLIYTDKKQHNCALWLTNMQCAIHWCSVNILSTEISINFRFGLYVLTELWANGWKKREKENEWESAREIVVKKRQNSALRKWRSPQHMQWQQHLPTYYLMIWWRHFRKLPHPKIISKIMSYYIRIWAMHFHLANVKILDFF